MGNCTTSLPVVRRMHVLDLPASNGYGEEFHRRIIWNGIQGESNSELRILNVFFRKGATDNRMSDMRRKLTEWL